MKINSSAFEWALAAGAIFLALATGAAWIDKPLRAVEALTLVALGIVAGALLTRAIICGRQKRGRTVDPTA
jgi:hypothetical protein